MMTNSCYSYRVYNMYRVGGDPVKLNQQFYCRKRIIRNRLFHKGRIYWFNLDVLHKIQHEISQYRIPCVMHRIAHFERIVCKIVKLETSLIAILN